MIDANSLRSCHGVDGDQCVDIIIDIQRVQDAIHVGHIHGMHVMGDGGVTVLGGSLLLDPVGEGS